MAGVSLAPQKHTPHNSPPVPSSMSPALHLAASVGRCPPAELTELRLFAPSWMQGLKKPVKLFLGIRGRLLPLLMHLFDCVMRVVIAFPALPLQRRISFPAACAEQPADRHRSVGEITSCPLLRWRKRERSDEQLYICISMPDILCHSVGFLL